MLRVIGTRACQRPAHVASWTVAGRGDHVRTNPTRFPRASTVAAPGRQLNGDDGDTARAVDTGEGWCAKTRRIRGPGGVVLCSSSTKSALSFGGHRVGAEGPVRDRTSAACTAGGESWRTPSPWREGVRCMWMQRAEATFRRSRIEARADDRDLIGIALDPRRAGGRSRATGS